jgi:hypothetical protein
MYLNYSEPTERSGKRSTACATEKASDGINNQHNEKVNTLGLEGSETEEVMTHGEILDHPRHGPLALAVSRENVLGKACPL